MLPYCTISVRDIDIKPKHEFVGSTIRGVFGRGLRAASCPYINGECSGCELASTCVYFEFFENTRHMPNYRLNINLNQENFDFDIILFAHATSYIPYIIIAIKNMQHIGFGSPAKAFKIGQIYLNQTPISSDFTKQNELVFKPEFLAGDYKISTITPLRIKQKNSYVKSTLDLPTFIRQIAMRYEELTGKEVPKFSVSFSDFEQNFYFHDLTRYSNRQQTKMQFGGIMGEMIIKGLDQTSVSFLHLATLTAVGKSTAFGLGKIDVKVLDV